ncbi:hypothetical protein LTR49_000785 [Elasticomyces elasticus]|nr:hypothetical protein LTR49_000785 [Elasticomyces elasticus]
MGSDQSAEEPLDPTTIGRLMAAQRANGQRRDALENRLARVESTTNGLVRIRMAEVDALGNNIPRFQVDPDGTRTFYLPGLFDPPVTRSTSTTRGSAAEVQDTHLSPDRDQQNQRSPSDHGKQKAAETPDSHSGTQTQVRAITDADEDYICRTGTAQTDAVNNATGLPNTTSRQNDRPASNDDQFSMQSIRDGTAPEAIVEELRRLICDRNAECVSTCEFACRGKGRAKGKEVARSAEEEHTQHPEEASQQADDQLIQNEHGLPAEAFGIDNQPHLGTAGAGGAPENRPNAREPQAESSTEEEDRTGGPHESMQEQGRGEATQQGVSPPSEQPTDGQVVSNRKTGAAKSKSTRNPLKVGQKIVKTGKNWDVIEGPQETKNINDPDIREGRTRNSVGRLGSLAPGSTPAPRDLLATGRTTRASSQAVVSAPVVGGAILSVSGSAIETEPIQTRASIDKQPPPKKGRKAQDARGRKGDGVCDDEDEDEDFVKRPPQLDPVPEEDESHVSAPRPLLPQSILMPAGNSNVHYKFQDVDRYSSFRPHRRGHLRTTANTLHQNSKQYDYENNSDDDHTQFSDHAQPTEEDQQQDREPARVSPPPPVADLAAPLANDMASPSGVKRSRSNSAAEEEDGTVEPPKKKARKPPKKVAKPKPKQKKKRQAVNGEEEEVSEDD